jgi:maleylacetate reductase
MDFVRPPLQGRVVFGAGSVRTLADHAGDLGLGRLLLVGAASAEPHVTAAHERLGDSAVEVALGARAHVPAEDVESTAQRATDRRCDGIVAIGGGSAIGLAKAVAVRLAVPVVAVPTTYAGSEMTAVYGVTRQGRKHTDRHPEAAPRVVVYDPELTEDLPPPVSAETGVNAVAHCVEALYARHADPAMAAAAHDGGQRLVAALPRVVRAPRDRKARGEALTGAYEAGLALATCGMGLHHRICHVLGGASGASHGRLNAAVLPHVVALNAPHAPALERSLRDSLQRADVAAALWDWISGLGAPASLPAAGAGDLDLDEMASRVTEQPVANPAPVSRAAVRDLLDRTAHGAPPEDPTGSRAERTDDDLAHG